MPNGFLLIDKPVGLRSAECVAWVKRLFGKNTKVGHAGTLDSTASGLLIVLLGTATRLSDYAMKLPKVYEAVVRLGSSTDTCDASGRILFRKGAAGNADLDANLNVKLNVEERAFDSVLYSFLGTRMQRPPEISALKLNGKVSHKAARGGEPLNLEPRPVVVTSAARLSSFSGESRAFSDESPIAAEGAVTISVACGKGTYIRSIARDIGEKLGCGAHVEALRRLSVGPFRVQEASSPGLDAEMLLSRLRSSKEIIRPFQRVVLTEEAERRLWNGLDVPLEKAGRYFPGTLELKNGLCVEGQRMISFVGLIERDGVTFLKPRSNIQTNPEEGPGGVFEK